MDEKRNNPDAIWLQIAGYLAGDASVGDRAAMEQWISESPENKETFGKITQAWDKTPERPKSSKNADFDVDAFEARVAREIGVARLDANGSVLSRGSLRGWVGYGGIAIVTCVLIVSVALVNGLFIDKSGNRTGTHITPPTKIFSTRSGQRLSVLLPDGSKAILAPATTLKISGRNADLAGEAVFTVTQRSEAPFIVRAGGSITRVLGTTFGVRKYENDLATRVAVVEGKVVVASSVAVPGDVVTVTDTSTHVSHSTNISGLLEWTTGKLTFRQAPVTEVFEELSRWYGVNISTEDPILGKRGITMAINGQTLEQALEGIAFVTGSSYKRTSNSITFTTR